MGTPFYDNLNGKTDDLRGFKNCTPALSKVIIPTYYDVNSMKKLQDFMRENMNIFYNF